MSQINETAIKTPGVYTTEIPSFPPSVAQVSTAIPAFIGYTQKRLDEDGNKIPAGTIKPMKIYSFLEYEQYFGKAENEKKIEVKIFRKSSGSAKVITSATATITDVSPHNINYAIRLYFENGGGPCYIVSVAETAGTVSDTELVKGLDSIEAFDEPTIILFPEGQALDEKKYYSLVSLAIDQCAKLQDRFTLIDVHTQKSKTDTTINNFRGENNYTKGFIKTNNLNYGAAYYPNLKTVYEYQYDEADVKVVLETDGVTAAAKTMDKFLNTDKDVYNSSKEAISKLGPILPPSPAVAGIYANVDGTKGVWKAPANISINSIYEVTDFITDEEQDSMNVDVNSGKSVNAIRAFSGKGILVWGARTLDGLSNEWRYISIRRFFLMVEESAKKSTIPYVFEPNDANTWIKIRAMLENYLTVLWRQGALAGAKPEHAFYVKCGLGQTMTAQDILKGLLIVEIGMAAVRPAEFIILRFSHKMQES